MVTFSNVAEELELSLCRPTMLLNVSPQLSVFFFAFVTQRLLDDVQEIRQLKCGPRILFYCYVQLLRKKYTEQHFAVG